MDGLWLMSSKFEFEVVALCGNLRIGILLQCHDCEMTSLLGGHSLMSLNHYHQACAQPIPGFQVPEHPQELQQSLTEQPSLARITMKNDVMLPISSISVTSGL